MECKSIFFSLMSLLAVATIQLKQFIVGGFSNSNVVSYWDYYRRCSYPKSAACSFSSSLPVLFSNLPQSGCKYNSDKQEGEETDLLADEQVLLAVRSYLVRRHRLPWREKLKRRQDEFYCTKSYLETTPRDISSISYYDSDEAIGYFWHDPTQLKHLTQPNHNDFTDTDCDMETEFSMNDGEQLLSSQEEYNDESPTLNADNTFADDDIGGSLFTNFASCPDETRVRRSNVAKTTWSDPEFRRKWWAKRWGDRVKLKSKEKTRMEAKLRKIPPDILQSYEFKSALLDLDDNELTSIVQSYVSSNRKRAASRRKTDASAPETECGSTVDHLLKVDWEQFAFKISEEGQRETQLKRSEKARLAYLTRLANKNSRVGNSEQQKRSTNESPPRNSELENEAVMPYDPDRLFTQTFGRRSWLYARSSKPSERTYEQAMSNLRDAINASNNTDVSAADVQLLLEPERLAGRKELLVRILKKKFGLFGKCVQIDANGKKEFATHSTIQRLGNFILDLIRNEQQQHFREEEALDAKKKV